MHRRIATGVVAIAVALAPASLAGASDATLGATLHTWAQRVGVDAHSVALAAQNRHPQRMVSSARRFRAHALKARAAIRAQRASTPVGRRAKRLAVVAFSDYAVAGRLWMTSGQARLRGQGAVANRDAGAAAIRARAGNRLLVRAGRLLP
jgi:hypothetical protein